MLILSSLVNDRTLKSICPRIAKAFLIIVLIGLSQAGVIKKRDVLTVNKSDNIVRDIKETEIAPTISTILKNASEIATTKLQPASKTGFATEASKELTNNEILLNEVKKLFEKDDKITISNNNTEIKAQNDNNKKNISNIDSLEKLQENQNVSTNTEKETELKRTDNHDGISPSILNFENKEQQLGGAPLTTTEFSSNDIKEEIIQSNIEPMQLKKVDIKGDEKSSDLRQLSSPSNVTTNDKQDIHLSSFENTLQSPNEEPRPSSRNLTELETETVSPSDITQNKTPPQQENAENVVGNSNEQIKIQPILETMENGTFPINETLETPKNIQRAETVLETTETSLIVSTDSSPTKLETKEDTKLHIPEPTTTTLNVAKEPYIPEVTTTTPSVAKELHIPEVTITTPSVAQDSTDSLHSSESEEIIKDSFPKHFAKAEPPLNQELNSNSIQNGLDQEEVLLTTIKPAQPKEIITKPTTQQGNITLQSRREDESLLFDENKVEYSRSMFTERKDINETSTIDPIVDNGLLTTTTIKPLILSLKDDVKESLKENIKERFKENKDIVETNITHSLEENDIQGIKNVGSSFMEKRPKFINDNSTNAQQLNLPNNAEVWSLASMKSLPKTNFTIATAQTHNQTDESKHVILHNTTAIMHNNSEKNLLDWSQIMMNKELSTTTSNEGFKQEAKGKDNNKSNNENLKNKTLISVNQPQKQSDKDLQVLDTTTSTPEISTTSAKIQSGNDQMAMKPLTEQDSSTTILSYTTTSGILSNSNDDNNEQDKKFQENTNNRTETLTTSTETPQSTTYKTPAATVNNSNNPLNTSMSIEPNLNEINLTSNQTQVNVNNDRHTSEASQSTDVDVDVNAEANSTSTTTATPTMTTTEATAVVDMTTLEQNSSETTTVSIIETGRQNTSTKNNVVITQHNNNNVIFEEFLQNKSKNVVKENVDTRVQDNTFDNIELNSNIVTATTTVIPITTFRPSTLAITPATSPPPTLQQEIDQNGNDEQQQSINILDDRYSTKANETNFETTTQKTVTTTSTALAITNETENILTSSSSLKNNTSSSKGEVVINKIAELKLDLSSTTITTITTTAIPETTTQTTPNKVDDETTTFEPFVTGGNLEKKETETTTTRIETETTPITTAVPKTPVVVIHTQSEALNESSTYTTTTSKTTEENKIESTTQQESEIKEKEEQSQTELEEENISNEKDAENETTTMSSTPLISSTVIAATTTTATATTDVEGYNETLLDTTTTTTSTTTQFYSPTISTDAEITASTTTTTTDIGDIFDSIHSTTTEIIQTTTEFLTESDEYTTFTYSEMIPPTTSTHSPKVIANAGINKSLPTLATIMGGNSGNMYSKNPEASGETDVNVIIATTVSVIGVIALVLLVAFLYLMRKRQKQTSYSQRCRPVSLDEYTIDNVSVGGSIRKSSGFRSSKRTYGNLAFDDPSLRHNLMGVHELAKFAQEKLRIFEEFRDVPQITAKLDEVPPGCEDKNRYANVLPLPETRVMLQRLNDDEKTEYINANYVTGPKDLPNYYIACQAPLDATVEDFWRMIWEQQSRVIIQATDLIENGVEKCAEYLPPSVTLDNHSTFGNFQITLQSREVKDKYAISTIVVKHVGENATRELTHYWYKWPEVGVPAEEAPIIAMLLEARSSLISYAIEQATEKEKSSIATSKSPEEGNISANSSATSPATNSNESIANGSTGEINGNINMVHIKKTARNQGPLTIHCSPGTGRTGTIIACDIAIRSLETPKRNVDVPQIVYYVRRGRASAVLTKEQYEFIYKVANMYAAKITNSSNYN